MARNYFSHMTNRFADVLEDASEDQRRALARLAQDHSEVQDTKKIAKLKGDDLEALEYLASETYLDDGAEHQSVIARARGTRRKALLALRKAVSDVNAGRTPDVYYSSDWGYDGSEWAVTVEKGQITADYCLGDGDWDCDYADDLISHEAFQKLVDSTPDV